jgi:hypothetical protein
MAGLVRTAASVAAWTGWMGSLLIAEWCLNRKTIMRNHEPLTPSGTS